MKSNCVFWSLALYWRRHRKGREGYIMVRWSRWGPFPHMLYSEARRNGSLRVVSYKPTSPQHKPVPPVMFAGRARFGDFPDTEPTQ